MASAVCHFAVGASLVLPLTAIPDVTRSVRPAALVVAAGLVAAAPDLDTAFFGVIPYGHFFGHRGFFHSPFFAILLSLLLSSMVFAISRRFPLVSWLTIFLAFSAAGVSHGLLDAMTNARLGVMLLYPWTEERLFLPWRPLRAPSVRLARLSWEELRPILSAEAPLIIACISLSTLVTATLRRLPFGGPHRSGGRHRS